MVEILEKLDIVALIVAVNLVLGGLSAFLHWLAPKTKATWDNKAAEWLSKATSWLAKVIDWLGNNTKPKDEKKP